MKLELGGGTKPRGDGWINIDLVESADIKHDLNSVPWPIQNDSVLKVYSSHCLEHLNDPMKILHELCRICVINADIEIRVPHPVSDLAMVWDHKHTFSPIAAINADQHFPEEYWKDKKRLKIDRIEYHPSILLEEAKKDLPFLTGLSDEVIMKWIPRTCHECRFFYTVKMNPRDYHKQQTANALNKVKLSTKDQLQLQTTKALEKVPKVTGTKLKLFSCIYRSQEVIGHLNCGCSEPPTIHRCSHPDLGGTCVRLKEEGNRKQLVEEGNHKMCQLCSLRVSEPNTAGSIEEWRIANVRK